LQLISLQLLVQSYTTNVYDRERNFWRKVNVYGGGSTGQAEAVRMALARAMCRSKCWKQISFETRRFIDKRSEWLNVEIRSEKLVRNFNSRNVNIMSWIHLFKTHWMYWI
jgi:ribosomal protein S9